MEKICRKQRLETVEKQWELIIETEEGRLKKVKKTKKNEEEEEE